MWRNSPGSVWRAISASVPAISTPVGPAPTTTKLIQAARSSRRRQRSARSKAPITRERMSKASARVLSPGACGAHSSCPK